MILEHLMIAAISLVALGMLALGGLLAMQQWRRARGQRAIDRAISHGLAVHAGTAEGPRAAAPAAAEDPLWLASMREQGRAARWLDSPMGKRLVVDEDRRLIEQCGFPSSKAQLAFLAARIGLALLLPLLYAVLVPGSVQFMYLAICFTLGFLSPKWFLGWYAKQRKQQVARELPLFVDLIGLLQGVGLSLDQTLQVIGKDFRGVLRVLSGELEIANRLYNQGRSREQSLYRLGHLHDNMSLANLVALLVQVDKHGGAVQEPLRLFSERLRENRKSEMKEQIGKITVKMTVVMVSMLLPALILVTAGPGFLAIVRSLGAMAR
jgi:tight adherence protein C